MRRTLALLVATLASVGPFVHPGSAEGQVAIAAPACADLDVHAIERALEVEIDDVAAAFRDLAAPVVLLGCADGRVRIEITDPVTDKSVARTVPMPPADRERVLALAIAQLFLTSWLELLLEGSEVGAPGAAEAEARARDAVAASLTPPPSIDVAPAPERDVDPEPASGAEAPASSASAPAITGEISLEAGPRVRLEGEGVVSGWLAARGQMVLDGLVLLGVRLDFDAARLQRTRGAVDLYVGSASLLAGLRTPAVGPFFVDGSLGVGAVVLVLEGRPYEADVAPGSTRAIAAQALVEVAPSLRAGPLIIALPLVLSGIAFAPEGRVSGEAPVVVGGPAFSAGLRLALDLGGT